MAAFVMFSSCGGNTGGKVAQEDSLVIDTVATLEQDTTEDVQAQLTETLQSGDAAQVQAAIEKVAGEVQAAIQSGDQQAAEKYASQIKAFVVNTLTVDNLIDAAKNLPANAQQTAREGKNAVKADANAAREAADAAAEKAKADAKAAADQAVEDAKEKAGEKVDEAAAKASEKADQAIQDATDKAKKKLGL